MKQILSVIVILLLSAAPAVGGQISLMVIDNNSYLAALPEMTCRRRQGGGFGSCLHQTWRTALMPWCKNSGTHP